MNSVRQSMTFLVLLVLAVGCGARAATVAPETTPEATVRATVTPVRERPTHTVTPTKVRVAKATPTGEKSLVVPVGDVLATTKMPVNLRSGPGTDFVAIGGLAEGDSVTVVGRLADDSWLLVEPDGGKQAWMTGSDKYVDVDSEALAGVPVADAPVAQAIDTPTPVMETEGDDGGEVGGQEAAEPISTPEPTATTPAEPAPDAPAEVARPETGVIKPNTTNTGCGEFEAENGTSQDGVVALMMGDQAVAAVYVRAGETGTISGMGDGVYQIVFTTGSDWDGNRFTQDAGYRRFEDALSYETTASTCSVWNITLHGVVGGTAATDVIGADQFPDLGH